jgi:hypothetical protein
MSGFPRQEQFDHEAFRLSVAGIVADDAAARTRTLYDAS